MLELRARQRRGSGGRRHAHPATGEKGLNVPRAKKDFPADAVVNDLAGGYQLVQLRDAAPGQLQIDWTAPAGATDKTPSAALPDSRPANPSPPLLIQRLPWDFKETFPQPTPEALEAGIVSEEDAEPENVRAMHDEHARELLAVLHDLDAVLDARRRGVDPATGRVPTTPAARERLQKLFANEPQRLERCPGSRNPCRPAH